MTLRPRRPAVMPILPNPTAQGPCSRRSAGFSARPASHKPITVQPIRIGRRGIRSAAGSASWPLHEPKRQVEAHRTTFGESAAEQTGYPAVVLTTGSGQPEDIEDVNGAAQALECQIADICGVNMSSEKDPGFTVHENLAVGRLCAKP